METNQYLIDFYNNYDEDSRLTLKYGTVEFLTTMHYIEKYILLCCWVRCTIFTTGKINNRLCGKRFVSQNRKA